MESGQVRPRRGGAKSIGVHGTPGVGKGQLSRPPPQPEQHCQCPRRTGSASSLPCQLSRSQQPAEPPVTDGDSRNTQSLSLGGSGRHSASPLQTWAPRPSCPFEPSWRLSSSAFPGWCLPLPWPQQPIPAEEVPRLKFPSSLSTSV